MLGIRLLSLLWISFLSFAIGCPRVRTKAIQRNNVTRRYSPMEINIQSAHTKIENRISQSLEKKQSNKEVIQQVLPFSLVDIQKKIRNVHLMFQTITKRKTRRKGRKLQRMNDHSSLHNMFSTLQSIENVRTTLTPLRSSQSIPISIRSESSCSGYTAFENLFTESYNRQADFIRQGITSNLIAEMYNGAIETVVIASGSATLAAGSVNETSRNDLFDVSNGYTLKHVDAFISTDQSKAHNSRVFPDYIEHSGLPNLTAVETSAIDTERNASWERICSLLLSTSGTWPDWNIDTVTFPSDNVLRSRENVESHCTAMETRSLYAQELGSYTYSGFVIGLVEQIVLSCPDNDTAQTILSSHVSQVYNAAMCSGNTGNDLKILTNHLESYLEQVKITLDHAPSGNAVRELLPDVSTVDISAWRKVIRSSEALFGSEIEFLSSRSSSGKACRPRWDGATLHCDDLTGILRSKATLENVAVASTFGSVATSCAPGFEPVYRLEQNITDNESCCSSSCLRSIGNHPNHIVVNEMCCKSCNTSDTVCDKQAEAGIISIWIWLSLLNR